MRGESRHSYPLYADADVVNGFGGSMVEAYASGSIVGHVH